MLKSIGYVGYGFVGKACHKAFEHNSEAIIVDPKHSETTWEEFSLYQPRLTFVCLPAPTLEDGSVDASLIYDVFQKFVDMKYTGIIVLKSTLPPAIVHDIYSKFMPLRYVYSPEFLREASWAKDAVSPSQVILAGDPIDCHELIDYYKNHSAINHTKYVVTDYKAAALAKYTINCFLATKVIFMNQMYQLMCDQKENKQISDLEWSTFTDILQNDIRLGYSHMTVPGPDGLFGYGGTCFPKDMAALAGMDENSRLSLIRDAILANTKTRIAGK